ncbi:PRC-barrel domain-containing protein [Pseudooceanicola nanhaiensis]|uniref:PRC-barrel domain-containing protein n=1 Tax=Pseudooceanicola nanhaiensis TaxID=375761 RepID=UPI001CD676CB|nr:PRC-barrel domain-containing protein [Pseudooceanicola nanhaiensis]MCA0918971.1 PRC-barrel domain-containing protein [Pseudooceanicola nanhaiensis]
MKTMFQTTSRAALIALIAAAPISAAYAQTASEEAPADAQIMPEADASASADVTAPETGAADEVAAEETMPADPSTDMASDDMIPADGSTDMAADSTMPADSATGMGADVGTDMSADTDMAAAEEPAKPVDGQITMQDGDTILAQDLLGATVYNDMDENVGDISDFIISMDGNVEGVVIGVGGFLGLGEKSVAIEMAALDVVADDAGNPRLVTSATQADLEAAPEFVTADEQAAQADNDAMMNSGSAGTTAPVE